MGMSPSTLSTISMVSQGVGAVTSAFGAKSSAQNTQSNLLAQAGMADVNARIAELGAQSALQQGQHQIGSLTMRAGQIKSSQRARLAANGVDLGVGNAAELQASTDLMKEIDVNTAELNAIRNAWGYRSQGVNFQNEALLKRTAAGNIKPGMAFTSSLLGSAGSVAANWYKFANNSTPPAQTSYSNGNVYDTEYY